MIAVALVIAQAAGTIEVLDRATADYRHYKQLSTAGGAPPGPPTAVLDLSDQLTARARLTARRWDWTVTYAPAVTLPSIGQRAEAVAPGQPAAPVQEQAPLFLQNASTAFTWHDRFLRLTSSGGFTYGNVNSTLLAQPQPAVGQPPSVQVAPQPTTIQFLSLYGDQGASLTLDRRSVATLSVGYQESGQLDPPATGALLPRQYGPRARASVDSAVDRLDHLLTEANASAATFSSAPCLTASGAIVGMTCAPTADIASLREGLRRRLSRTTELTVAAGAAVTAWRAGPGASESVRPLPVVVATLSQRLGLGEANSLQLNAQASPMVNPLLGTVNEVAQATAALLQPLHGRMSLKVTAAASHAFSAPNAPAFTFVSLDVQAIFKASNLIEASLGDQTLASTQDTVGSFASTVWYAAVTARCEPLHF